MSGTRNFLHQLRADHKKLGMICACLALAMLFWARLIVIADMPRTAIADPPALEGRAERGPSDRVTSHNEADATATVTMETTPNRDPFAQQRTSGTPAQRSVAE